MLFCLWNFGKCHWSVYHISLPQFHSLHAFLPLALAPGAVAHSSSGIGEGEGMRSCRGRGVTVTDPAAALGPTRPLRLRGAAGARRA